MPGWLQILAWGLAFSASHFALSSIPVRRPLMARLGERGFQGLYSLVAFATFVPMVGAWWDDRHGGPLLWMLRDAPGLRELCIAVSVLGLVLVVAAVVQPSPTGLAPGAPRRARGATRITRHGLFVGVAVWAAAHLLMNGWASDVAFFGTLVVFPLLGALHQDARKRALDDGSLAAFFAETSLVPFAAILGGRTRLVAGELPWIGLSVGLGLGVGLFLAHDLLFR